MDDRDEQENDESTDESVEIPVNVEGEETLGEESSSEASQGEGLADETSDPEDEQEGESSDVSSDSGDQPEPSDEELEDLYVEPDESDVEVVEPDDSAPEEPEADEQEQGGPEEQEPEEQEAGQQEGAEGPSRQELLERVDKLEGQVEELEQERDELQEERDEFEDRMMRAAADLENFRKRAKREKEELKKYGAKPLLEDLIQNIDNLERALEHADSSNEENIIEGVEMVLRQLHSNLEKHGIEQFDSEGEDFDPEQHEAIQQVETTEHETGTIVDEFQKGYFLHDRLLRPAMVSVAENVSGGDEESGEADQQESTEPADSEGTDQAEQGAGVGEESSE